MLNLFAEIRPDEKRETWTTFLVLFGIMASHALMETARDALFLARLPPAHLAWVYLSIAVLSSLLFAIRARTSGRTGRTSLALWMIGAALVTLGFWLLVTPQRTALLYGLYMWSALFATLVVVRFWTYVSDLFTVGQAKRLFAMIGAGSVLGAIFGSSLARLMTSSYDAKHLLLASAAVLIVTSLIALCVMPATTSVTTKLSDTDFARPLRVILASPYLKRVGALILLSTISLTLIDFMFKSAVAMNVAADGLATFFSTTYLALNVLSLLAQLFLVGGLVRSLSMSRVLSILPMLLLFGSAGFLLTGGLLAALALKSFDGIFRHSLHRTTIEVLYVPMNAELRNRVKGLMDVMGQRGGQALASLIILSTMALWNSHYLLAFVLLSSTAAWLAVASTLEGHYLDIFRNNLKSVGIASRYDFPELDLASLETLLAGLNSAHDGEVIAALDLLAEQERLHVVPALILYHPSPRVVLRALDLFTTAGRTDILSITDRLLSHENADIRAATLRARSWMAAPSVELHQEYLQDPSAIVRATALIGLVAYGGGDMMREARQTMETIVEFGTSEERLSLARAIRRSPGAGYEELLIKLASCESDTIKLAAVHAMREILSARFIEVLMQLLPNRRLRSEARTTLRAIGPNALSAMDAALDDRMVPRNVRLNLPRVIAMFPDDIATEILQRHLETESDGAVRYQILRTLERLCVANPDLPLRRDVIRAQLEKTLRNVFELLCWRLRLDQESERNPACDTEVQGMIRALLHHKQELAQQRLFYLISLLHSREDVRKIHRGIRSTDRRLRASSVELLGHFLVPPYRAPILGLMDELPIEEKLDRAGPYECAVPRTYEDLLAVLLETGGMGMRSLVVYHIGELKLHRLRRNLEMLPSDLGGLVAQRVERTLALLQETPS